MRRGDAAGRGGVVVDDDVVGVDQPVFGLDLDAMQVDPFARSLDKATLALQFGAAEVGRFGQHPCFEVAANDDVTACTGLVLLVLARAVGRDAAAHADLAPIGQNMHCATLVTRGVNAARLQHRGHDPSCRARLHEHLPAFGHDGAAVGNRGRNGRGAQLELDAARTGHGHFHGLGCGQVGVALGRDDAALVAHRRAQQGDIAARCSAQLPLVDY